MPPRRLARLWPWVALGGLTCSAVFLFFFSTPGRLGVARAAPVARSSGGAGASWPRPGAAPGVEASAIRPASAAGAALPARRVVHDPARPINGGAPVVLVEAPASAALAARAPSRAPCSSSLPGRAGGSCRATLALGGSLAQVDVEGEIWLDEAGQLHLERGAATVVNLAERPLKVLASGRVFTVPSLGKIDVDDARPEPLEARPSLSSDPRPTGRPPRPDELPPEEEAEVDPAPSGSEAAPEAPETPEAPGP